MVPPPILIVGAGRSGTSFLRDQIASSAACRATPHDANNIWRYGNERHPDDCLPVASLDGRRRVAITRMLYGLAGIRRASSPCHLVEKTCHNTLRIPFVRAVFPDARFVHIVRHGHDVAASALERWRTPVAASYLFERLRHFPLRNARAGLWFLQNLLAGWQQGRQGLRVWGPRYPGIEADVGRLPELAVCARQWTFCVEQALRDLASVPAEQQFFVRYEDLATNPATMERLCRFLELPDPDRVMASYRRTIRTDGIGRGRRRLSPDDLRLIAPLTAPTLEKLGYTSHYVTP